MNPTDSERGSGRTTVTVKQALAWALEGNQSLLVVATHKESDYVMRMLMDLTRDASWLCTRRSTRGGMRFMEFECGGRVKICQPHRNFTEYHVAGYDPQRVEIFIDHAAYDRASMSDLCGVFDAMDYLTARQEQQ